MRPEPLLLLGLLGLSACPAAPGAGDAGPPWDGGAVATSARNVLRFKGPERLTFDYAQALGLAPGEVCNELGQYSCAGLVHTVALGGVDPYGAGLYEAPGRTGATTPMAVERVALSACQLRVARDLATPGAALVFRSLDTQGHEARAALVELSHRALLREPTEAELAAWLGLAAAAADAGSAQPARDWMTAVCFAMLTSAESVFY